MLFVRCTRNGEPQYSSHGGMDMETVRRLLTELGCTDITFIPQDEYDQATRLI